MDRIEKLKFPSINGLRAFSILFVILRHLASNNNLFDDLMEYRWLTPFIKFFSDGHLGVNVFFVISGFLITSLLLQEESQTGTVSLKKFYIRRTLRIFPAYYFLLLVYFILQLMNLIQISQLSWISALTYTKYFTWRLDWFTAHAWSLSIEEHFYILWPLIFMGGDKWRKTIALILVLMVPFIRTWYFYHPVSWINELTIFMRVDAIAIGCLFALFSKNILKFISPYWSIVFPVSLLILFSLRYFKVISDFMLDGLSVIFIPLGLTHGTIANLFISLLLMYSVFGPQKTWYKLLNSRIMNYIGLLSYSIYLWQQFFISGGSYWVQIFPQNILFILALALFSYHIIEKPFLKLKDKFSKIHT